MATSDGMSQEEIAACEAEQDEAESLAMTLADIECEGQPECFHCESELPKSAKAERNGDYIIVYCPSCGCMTPFPIG